MKYNMFNLSHKRDLSFNMGELVPVMSKLALPGDVWRMDINSLIRTQPLLAPLMHRVDVRFHAWFVPIRIVWDEFEDFITGGEDGDNASIPPYLISPAGTGFAVGSLSDHLAIPPGVAGKNFSVLRHRCYNLIWNEFYRDQDLQDKLVISKASGLDTTTSLVLQHCCWEKDYFTSMRPDPQKGAPVTIPLTGNAPIKGIAQDTHIFSTGDATDRTMTLNPTVGVGYSGAAVGAQTNIRFSTNSSQIGLEADLSDVTAVDIDSLRLASALQRYKENLMRFGSRYMERLIAAWGVPNLDARLQLPEYLGGGSNNIQFSEVLQTAEGDDPVGEMRGHGITPVAGRRIKKYIPEFGYIIVLCSIRPKTSYPQAVDRDFLYRVKEDFFQPELANIGQQEIWAGELYAGATSQYATAGYQDRYDEFRRAESSVAGEFRDTLDYWHMARIFETQPALNAEFVKCTPTTRVYAATSADQIYAQVKFNIKCKRKIPKVAKPRLF